MDFNREAQNWDTARRTERAEALAALILKAMGDARGAALDFGCGTGLLTFAIAPHVGTIYGYDPSDGMREKFLQKRAENAFFLPGEEMQSRSYDAIFSSMVMHHIRDYRAELARLRGLLNPGGRFLWIDLDPEGGAFHKGEPDFDGHDGFDRDEVRAALTACGFRSVSVETAYKGVKMVEGTPVPYTLFLAAAE